MTTPEALDAAADRLEQAGAHGAPELGNITYATEREVRLLREAANTIRILQKQEPIPVPPPHRPPSRMWTFTSKNISTS